VLKSRAKTQKAKPSSLVMTADMNVGTWDVGMWDMIGHNCDTQYSIAQYLGILLTTHVHCFSHLDRICCRLLFI